MNGVLERHSSVEWAEALGANVPAASAAAAAQMPALSANFTTVLAFLCVDRLTRTAGVCDGPDFRSSGQTGMRSAIAASRRVRRGSWRVGGAECFPDSFGRNVVIPAADTK
ncbi:hypothetical protein GCM10009827_116430 [Dactylosporangium maewongense]|uniref:Uncharacterized protein n=1 Tax=Dactylosporangium maewongense TaxID=634393 RepID=A0ABN2DGB7_9ACTN